jgi:hypothetical protein
MITIDSATEFFERADAAYASGDLDQAELLLLSVLRFRSITAVTREEILVKLAGLACQRGQFIQAAHFYAQDLQSKSRRLPVTHPQMQHAMRNYRKLLELAQPDTGDVDSYAGETAGAPQNGRVHIALSA